MKKLSNQISKAVTKSFKVGDRIICHTEHLGFYEENKETFSTFISKHEKLKIIQIRKHEKLKIIEIRNFGKAWDFLMLEKNDGKVVESNYPEFFWIKND